MKRPILERVTIECKLVYNGALLQLRINSDKTYAKVDEELGWEVGKGKSEAMGVVVGDFIGWWLGWWPSRWC